MSEVDAGGVAVHFLEEEDGAEDGVLQRQYR